jgi:DNA-binding transcriptional LysR family regulator
MKSSSRDTRNSAWISKIYSPNAAIPFYLFMDRPALNSSDRIPLRQLQLFVTLAEVRSFVRAADQSGITQPALSLSIRQLEERLGARLLHRSSHQVSLTDAGERLLPQAMRLLNTADHSFTSMHEAVEGKDFRIRLGATPSTVHLMAAGVAALRAQGNPADFSIRDGRAGELLACLRSAQLDIVLGVHFEPQDDLETTPVLADELVLLVHERHRFAERSSVPWKSLAGESIAHFRQGNISALSASALKQHALAVSPRYDVEQLASLFGLVQSGLAVGILPRLYTRDLRTDAVRLVSLVKPVVNRAISLFRHRRLSEENPAAASCFDQLSRVIPSASHALFSSARGKRALGSRA